MSILVRGIELPDVKIGRCELWVFDETMCFAKRIFITPEKIVEVEEFEVWPNKDPSRKFTILKTKGGMHFMGPNGPVDPPEVQP